MTFGGQSKSGKTSSHTSSVEVSSCVISEEIGEHRISKILCRGKIKSTNKPLG